MAAAVPGINWYADPIVFNHHANTVLLVIEFQDSLLGARVLANVIEGLLPDAVKRMLDLRRQRPRDTGDLQAGVDAGQSAITDGFFE